MTEIESKTRKFVFYLAAKFSMMSLLSLTEPLRAANEIAGHALYDCRFVSQTTSVQAINGMSMPVEPDLPMDNDLDAVIVCASYEPEQAINPKLINWLHRLDAHGTALGAADTGALILAKAGLLHGHRTTLHWMNLDSFQENYPLLEISSSLFEYTARRFSCAGATTGMDLMLFIIGQHHGDYFGAKVANHFIRGPIRSEEQHQSAELARAKGLHPKVRAVIEKMEINCEQPLSIATLADEAGLSLRRLETLFQREVGITPARFYQACRIQKARNILQQTSIPVTEVALVCGFASRTQFSSIYRKIYGHPPSAERKNAYSLKSISNQ